MNKPNSSPFIWPRRMNSPFDKAYESPAFVLSPALTGTWQWFQNALQGSVAEIIQSQTALWTKLNKETL